MQFEKVCNNDKLLRELASFDIDFITYNNGQTNLFFKRNLTQNEEAQVTVIVEEHDVIDPLHIIADRRIRAIEAFDEIMALFTTENVSMGITQAGKTRLIQHVLQECINFGKAGSLNEAVTEASAIVVLPEYAPFITEERKAKFVNLLTEAYNSI